MFTCVAADPPWRYRDGLTMSSVKRSSAAHYDTMSVDDICRLGEHGRIAGHPTADNGFLFLWVTNPFLLDGSGAAVCRAWGYEPRQLITWVKGRISQERLIAQIGMGHLTRGATEHMLLATRGKTKDLILSRAIPNVFIAPRGRHSRKPDEAYALIERIAPGPYLELFAREPRFNWQSWGNEVAA